MIFEGEEGGAAGRFSQCKNPPPPLINKADIIPARKCCMNRPPFCLVGKVAQNKRVCMEIRRQISLITF